MASLDYSRFANIGDSDDSSDDEGMTIKSSSAQPPHQALPSDLSKRLQEMASHPGALENFDAEIEAMKQAALKQKSSPGELGEDAGAKIGARAEALHDKLAQMQLQKESMDAQMARLEQLASAGDPASVSRLGAALARPLRKGESGALFHAPLHPTVPLPGAQVLRGAGHVCPRHPAHDGGQRQGLD